MNLGVLQSITWYIFSSTDTESRSLFQELVNNQVITAEEYNSSRAQSQHSRLEQAFRLLEIVSIKDTESVNKYLQFLKSNEDVVNAGSGIGRSSIILPTHIMMLFVALIPAAMHVYDKLYYS